MKRSKVDPKTSQDGAKSSSNRRGALSERPDHSSTGQREEIERKLASLPDSPGVYLFRSDLGENIYIGKALNLRNRVRSYWNEAAWRERPKLAVMMPKVKDLEVILTNSEKEALLLEATLVRQHMPRYNVHLKDDRRYPWLAIEYGVAFPRLIMVRDPVRYRKENARARIFGPYVETGMMWQTVRVLRKVFPMRQRKRPLFRDRPCMNFHLGLCLGPCQKLVEEPIYDRMVKQVEMFLAGRQDEVVAQLRQDMKSASDGLQYEQAAKIRDRLAALETVIQKQQVLFQNQRVSQDVIAQAHTQRLISICLMKVREGKLISSEVVNLALVDKTNWEEAFQSFLDQYYTSCEDIAVPREVLLEHPVEDCEALQDLLTSKSNTSVKILVPQRGDKLNMVQMAAKNAQSSLEKETEEQLHEDAKADYLLNQLKEELQVANLPRRIECFDISNIQGSDNVASMVVFENAKAKKSDYRLFKIQTVEGAPDDFASMKEVVSRRYGRLLESNKPFPDLVIIDGGKGQLNAACEALNELGVSDQPILGLAKKQEEIYLPGRSDPLLLSRRSQSLLLLQRVRDEAHRFAITFHRKRRAKRSLLSGFDLLAGIGKARRKILLDHFGSFEKFKEATLEEIEAVPNIPKNVAAKVYTSLHEQKEDDSDA
ncbi:MAG: excinuclease ABC subunit C [Candidatus Melainabacteria bacterium]|nr:MAG: excinuclease ABC subunit C [Candidatus Melainabacteria bacterium]